MYLLGGDLRSPSWEHGVTVWVATSLQAGQAEIQSVDANAALRTSWPVSTRRFRRAAALVYRCAEDSQCPGCYDPADKPVYPDEVAKL